MPQLHLLCWDDGRRLSEHPSRRQREPDARDANSQLHLLMGGPLGAERSPSAYKRERLANFRMKL